MRFWTNLIEYNPSAAATYLLGVVVSGYMNVLMLSLIVMQHDVRFLVELLLDWSTFDLSRHVIQLTVSVTVLQLFTRSLLVFQLLRLFHAFPTWTLSRSSGFVRGLKDVVHSRIWHVHEQLGYVQFASLTGLLAVTVLCHVAWTGIDDCSPDIKHILAVSLLRIGVAFSWGSYCNWKLFNTPKTSSCGLSKELVDSLPRKHFVTQDAKVELFECMCSVCLAEYRHDDHIVQLPCNSKHVFHYECVSTWFAESTKCPLCMADIASLRTTGKWKE